MNYIWSILIVFCILFSFFTGNSEELVNALLNTFDVSLKNIINICGVIVFFNALLSVSIESGIIDKLSFLFKPIVKIMFPDIKNNKSINLIACSICANFLGLGLATTPIAFKILNSFKCELKNEFVLKKNTFVLVCLNASAFSFFPLTILSLREKYNSVYFINFYIVLILVSLFTNIFCVIFLRNLKYDLFN